MPAVTERQPDDIQKQVKPVRTEFKQKRSKRARRVKVHKRELPKAVVQPRTDLMYHGMLESPQRYDPRRNHLGAGVPDPHNPELTHDHFQELDRNQDGTIDPVERRSAGPIWIAISTIAGHDSRRCCLLRFSDIPITRSHVIDL